MKNAERLTVRWTIGDVSAAGFEALGWSVRGARAIFGPTAQYVICVNTVPLRRARALLGFDSDGVQWLDVTGALDPLIALHIDDGMAEGVGWKFAPLRIVSERFELSMDNDCILWRTPGAIADWLSFDDGRCVIAEDVRPAFGRFAPMLEVRDETRGSAACRRFLIFGGRSKLSWMESFSLPSSMSRAFRSQRFPAAKSRSWSAFRRCPSVRRFHLIYRI